MAPTKLAPKLVKVTDLHPDPKNPRRITERDLERLRRSIREDPDFMRLRPILARLDGTVYAGNMRLAAAMAEGWKEVPAILTDDPEAIVKKRAVKDNTQFGEWVEEELGEYLSELAEDDPALDFGALGLTDNMVHTLGLEEMANLADLRIDPGPDAAPGTKVGGFERPFDVEQDGTIMSLEDASPELKGALQLREDTLYLPPDDCDLQFGIPLFRSDRLLDKLPEPLEVWAGGDAAPLLNHEGFWLYNYSPHKTTSNAPLESCLLSFFTDDRFFLPWWSAPAYYVGKMLNAGVGMAIEPDFSLYGDAPPVMNFHQLYRSRWLARFMQDAGIGIVPRIPYPMDVDFAPGMNFLDYCFAGFPKSLAVAALNCQTPMSQEKEQQDRHVALLGDGLTTYFERGYHCDTLLVYGKTFGEPIIARAKVPDDVRVVFIRNFLAVRRELDLPYRES